VALVRRVSHRNFQHAGYGRNPDENWHGASFPHAARAVGLPSIGLPSSCHQGNHRDEPVHSTEVEPHAIFCLRNAYLGLALSAVRLAHFFNATLHRCADDLIAMARGNRPSRFHDAGLCTPNSAETPHDESLMRAVAFIRRLLYLGRGRSCVRQYTGRTT
jgi:hypothetical protein